MNKSDKIGKNIKKHRRRCKLSQSSLAHKVGISRTAVSDIENGRYNPNSDNLYAIAKALGVSMEILFE